MACCTRLATAALALLLLAAGSAISDAHPSPLQHTHAHAHASVVAAAAAAASDAGPTLEITGCGAVLGTWLDSRQAAAVFYGIPYGRSTAGTARWMPPAAAACWESSTRNCSAPGPICTQGEGGPPVGSLVESEDCLTVDVYVPASVLRKGSIRSDAEALPVVFFVPGISLMYAHSTSYPGIAVFAQRGDAIVVAVNYRVGPLGFLAHPALSKSDPRGVSGNYGILDQQLALQWVHDHIASFGGDSTRVTLMGQASGATCVLAHMCAPGSQALYQNVISLSGSVNISFSLEAAYEQNAKLLQYTPCSALADDALHQCLVNLPTQEAAGIFPTTYAVLPTVPSSPGGQHYPGLLIVDGVTIAAPLQDSLMQNPQGALLLQVAIAEMDSLEPDKHIYRLNPSDFEGYIEFYLRRRGFANSTAMASALKTLYAPELTRSIELTYQTMVSDVSYFCGTVETAFFAVAGPSTNPVYLNVIQQGPGNPLFARLGEPPAQFACHMWDYIAATHDWHFFGQHVPVPDYEPTADDLVLGEALYAEWVSFATNGTLPNLQTFDQNDDYPDSYVVGLHALGGPNPQVNFRRDVCEALLNDPFGFDRSFWAVG